MQGLAFDQRFSGIAAGKNPIVRGPAAPAVKTVGDDGRSDARQVNPDLMGAPGFGVAMDKGKSACPFGDDVESRCRFPVRGIIANRHFFPLVGMATDREFNQVAVAVGGRRDDGNIEFFDLPVFKLPHERGVGEIVAGDNDGATGIAVKAMNDARPFGSAHRAEGPEMVDECSGKSSFPVSLGWMDNHGRRFVDDDDVVVNVQDIKGYIFARCRRGSEVFDFVQAGFNALAGLEMKRSPCLMAIDANPSIFDQELQPGPTDSGARLGQVPVETLADILVRRYQNCRF